MKYYWDAIVWKYGDCGCVKYGSCDEGTSDDYEYYDSHPAFCDKGYTMCPNLHLENDMIINILL